FAHRAAAQRGKYALARRQSPRDPARTPTARLIRGTYFANATSYATPLVTTGDRMISCEELVPSATRTSDIARVTTSRSTALLRDLAGHACRLGCGDAVAALVFCDVQRPVGLFEDGVGGDGCIRCEGRDACADGQDARWVVAAVGDGEILDRDAESVGRFDGAR